MKTESTFSLKTQREAYKTKGIFHTPKALAEYLRSFLPEDVQEVYDPTCGAGDLLAVFPDHVKKYGQEIEPEFARYAHDNVSNSVIVCGDTLQVPSFTKRRFDYVIANPPFSIKWEQKKDVRFPFLAPKSKADYAFIFHCLFMAKKKSVILCFPGVLYRGNSEGKCRQYLVDNNLIESITQVAPKMFDDTSISTVVMVLNKDKDNTDILFTDEKGNKKKVSIEEVCENDYTLSVNTYIQEEVIKERINPLTLEISARKNLVKKLDEELRFSQVVAGFEGLSIEPLLDKLTDIINKYRITN